MRRKLLLINLYRALEVRADLSVHTCVSCVEDVADLWRLHLSLDSIDGRPAFSAPRRTRGAYELSTIVKPAALI